MAKTNFTVNYLETLHLPWYTSRSPRITDLFCTSRSNVQIGLQMKHLIVHALSWHWTDHFFFSLSLLKGVGSLVCHLDKSTSPYPVSS